jgi:hypothetical protein
MANNKNIRILAYTPTNSVSLGRKLRKGRTTPLGNPVPLSNRNTNGAMEAYTRTKQAPAKTFIVFSNSNAKNGSIQAEILIN